MENKPIKRNQYMIELSRDHHSGLLFCWKIKEGLKRNIEPERLKGYLNYFWNGHLKAHFLDEEALLFNRLDDPLCDKAKGDHKNITEHIGRINLSDNPGKEEYYELTEILNNHIRFEERMLFPYLESVLSAETLRTIGNSLAQAHPISFKDNYADEFWLKGT